MHGLAVAGHYLHNMLAVRGKKKQEALKQFAGRLKALRKARGLTQAQLAEEAGLTQGEVSKYEAGTRLPLWPAVTALEQVLGTTGVVEEAILEDSRVRRSLDRFLASDVARGLAITAEEKHALETSGWCGPNMEPDIIAWTEYLKLHRYLTSHCVVPEPDPTEH